MKERPIIFNGEMVRAILDGRKSQTRRVYKFAPLAKNITWSVENCPYGVPGDRLWVRETFCIESSREVGPYPPPFLGGRPLKRCGNDEWGDWWEQPHYKATDPTPELEIGTGDPGVRWSPSIRMPRWTSRITLEIVNVRVERVQEISEEDAIAEGISRVVICAPGSNVRDRDLGWKNYLWHGNFGKYGMGNKQSDKWEHQYSTYRDGNARGSFSSLWHLINAKRGFGWDAKPWVWVIEFKRV